MDIPEEHREHLKALGLGDEDFDLFDGDFVAYEYDEGKGARIYDPYYRTSYNEYIGIDGWSAWSSEKDTFMSDILKDVHEKVREVEERSSKPTEEEFSGQLRDKFGRTAGEGDPE